MGEHRRPRQEHLPKKLVQVREALGLTQNEMLRHLGLDEKLSRTDVSNYERDHREPALYVVLKYAKAAGVCLDALDDDELDLPEKLPTTPNHHALRPAPSNPRT